LQLKDKQRNQLLRSAAEDLSILVAGTEQAQVLRHLEPKGTPLATKAIEKLVEYAAGWPAGGNGQGGATNITHPFEERCPLCPAGYPIVRDCPQCNGTGFVTVTLTVPQHPDRTGEQVANAQDKDTDRFVAPSVLDAHLAEAARHLRLAADIASHAVIPVNAAPAKARDDSSDWCQSCARVTDKLGRPRAEPSAIVNGSVRRTPEGTMNGKDAAPLCSWCYGFVLGEKAWPPKALIERRADGLRVTAEAVDKAMGRKATA